MTSLFIVLRLMTLDERQSKDANTRQNEIISNHSEIILKNLSRNNRSHKKTK